MLAADAAPLLDMVSGMVCCGPVQRCSLVQVHYVNIRLPPARGQHDSRGLSLPVRFNIVL